MRKFQVTVNGNTYEVEVEEIKGDFQQGQPSVIENKIENKIEKKLEMPGKVSGNQAFIKSPMPGKIVETKVKVGDVIKEGDLVAILEAMKMENEIFSSVSGKVVMVNKVAGNSVEADDLLITVEK